MIRALLYPLLLLMAFGYAGLESEALALEEDAEEKMVRVQRVLKEPVPRESWILTHPLSCSGTWVKSCADFKPCKSTCFEEKQ